MGVIDKGEASGEELRRAVGTIAEWRTYYSQRVEMTFRNLISETTAYYKVLSPREEELVKLFGLGQTNEEIAIRQQLSVATIQGHRRNVMSKVGVKSTPELIIWAIRNGFVNGPEIGRLAV
jgi:two-component system response regulator NreC